jgi:hypothetical protein
LVVLGLALELEVAGQPVAPTTAYTRYWLLSTNAMDGTRRLGIQVDNLSQLLALNVAGASTLALAGPTNVWMAGRSSANDGGQGWFYSQRETVTVTTNLGTIFRSTANTNLLWYRQYSGPLNVKWFGARGDGVTDDTAPIQNAIDLLSSGGIVEFPPATYKFTDPAGLTLGNNVFLQGDGIGSSILDFSGATPSDYSIGCAGALTALPAFTVDVAAGDNTISFTNAPSLTTGDVFMLYNSANSSYSSYRTYYRAGEYFTVASVSGTNVATTTRAFAAYAANSTVTAYKVSAKTVGIRGFTMLFPQGISVPGIQLQLATHVELTDLALSGSQFTQIELDKCYEATVRNVSCRDYQDTAPALNYGIHVSNSQRISVEGSYLETSRHGLSFGGNANVGAVPCREITVADCYVSSSGNTVMGLDMHGNVEHALVSGCTLPCGLEFGGDHTLIVGNTIGNGPGLAQAGYAITDNGEPLGLNVAIVGNSITARHNFSSGLINISCRSGTTRTNTTISIKDNSIQCGVFGNATPGNQSIIIRVAQVSGATEDVNVDIGGNAIVTSYATASQYDGVYIETTASYGFKSVAIHDNVLEGACLQIIPNVGVVNIIDNTIGSALAHAIKVPALGAPTQTRQVWNLQDNVIMKSRGSGLFMIVSNVTEAAVSFRGNTSINNGQDGGASPTADTSAFIRGATRLDFSGNKLGDNQAVATQPNAYTVDQITDAWFGPNVLFGGLTGSRTATNIRGTDTDDSGNVSIGGIAPNVTGWGASNIVVSVFSTASTTNKQGIIEIGSQSSDASGNTVGSVAFMATANSGGDKRLVVLEGQTSGSTANHRGGLLNVYIKADNGSLTLTEQINRFGQLSVGGASPSSTLDVKGSFGRPNAVGGSTTLDSGHSTYRLNVDTGTVTLPSASGNTRIYTIKLVTPAVSGTVATTSSQLIDGATTYSLSNSNSAVTVHSDGSNWWIVNKTAGP